MFLALRIGEKEGVILYWTFKYVFLYRFGHSLISDEMKGEHQNFNLRGNFFNSKMVENSGTYPSNILKGECTLKSENIDTFLVETLTNMLLSKGNDKHGSDLMSLNIMVRK